MPRVVDQGAAHPRKAQTRCPLSAGTLSGLARNGVRFRPEPVSAFSRIMHTPPFVRSSRFLGTVRVPPDAISERAARAAKTAWVNLARYSPLSCV